MASPRTNLAAPSMAPWKALSSSSSRRRLRASASSIRPAERSASIAICLPGMASRLKRAATSAMRPEPLVTTMKFTTSRMAKTIRPTTTSPPIRKPPKACDHVAGGLRPLMAVGQDDAGGGDVQRQAQQGGEQQQLGKGGEVERPLQEQRHHQHQHRDGDGEGERRVQQQRRQRHHQHGEQQHDAERQGHVAARPDAAEPGGQRDRVHRRRPVRPRRPAGRTALPRHLGALRPVLVQLVPERPDGDAEDLRRAGAVAEAVGERFQDQVPLHLVHPPADQRRNRAGFRGGRSGGRLAAASGSEGRRRRLEAERRQLDRLGADHRPLGQQHGAVHGVLQLPHVAAARDGA